VNKNILIISGSPKKNGNTQSLIEWFCEGARSKDIHIEVVHCATLRTKANGCISCRKCQTAEKYECAIDDEVSTVLKKFIDADALVMATPLYFFGPSAQIKIVFDRMFSLYKWDNALNTMKTPLKGKKFILLASAYEDIGLEALEKPFKLTADYTNMLFQSLIVPNAGVSGDIRKLKGIREKAVELGKKVF
jgi:multimeric flavodoxin WrbA